MDLKRQLNIGIKDVRRLVIILALVVAAAAVYSCSGSSDAPVNNTAEYTGPDSVSEAEPVPSPPVGLDYSQFKHGSSSHVRLPCLVCHVRDENTAKVGFPGGSGHIPCASCHVEQFSDPNNAMCAICHTEPATGAMKASMSLKSFNAKFDHGRHLRQTSCAACHKPSRRGVALSIPTGSSAHNTCFTCHGPQTEIGEQNIGSCSTCHEMGVRRRPSEWAKAFQFGFSHIEHTRRGKTNCASCHSVLAGMPQGRQVTSPVTAMHFASQRGQSCAKCHNDKIAFGAEDPTNCRRCHEGSSFSF